jgi:hypothetical protein
MFGLERSLGSRIVTYADDLVILCRKGKAEEALSRLREIMRKPKLMVNEEKTRRAGRIYSPSSSVTTLHRRPVSVRVSRHFRSLGPSLLQLVTQHVHHRHSAARNAASLCNFRLQAYSTSGAGPRLNAK